MIDLAIHAAGLALIVAVLAWLILASVLAVGQALDREDGP